MDSFKRANAVFCTAWELNVRKFVDIDPAMKRKARKVARKKLNEFTNSLLDELTNLCYNKYNERAKEN